MNSVRRCGRFSNLLSRGSVSIMIALVILGSGNSEVLANSPQETRQIRIHGQNGTVARINGPKYPPNRLLVRYKKEASAKAIQAMHEAANAKVLREFSIVRGLQSVQLPAGTSVPEALRYYRGNPNVIYA